MTAPARMIGAAPAPWTISWTGEERFYLGKCRYAGSVAIMQSDAWGEGKPLFAKPHAVRQRQAIAHGLCDVCGRYLEIKTKVSLSQARPIPHSARGWEILQVEPLLCRACARVSLRHCPGLRRQIDAGIIRVRQVFIYEVQFAVMDEVYVERVTGSRARAIGHAKVHLKKYRDRDIAWLEGGAS